MRNFISRLPAQTIDSILTTLKSLPESEAPLVIFDLHNGRTVSGWVIDVATDTPQDRSLVIQVADDGGRRTQEAAYLSLDAIAMLRLPDMGKSVVALSDGRIDPVELSAPPGAYQLEREKKNLADVWKRELGAELVVEFDASTAQLDNERHRSVLSEVLALFGNDFFSLILESSAKGLVTEKIRSLRIGNAARQLSLQDGRLDVSVPFEGTMKERFDSVQFKREFDQLF